MRGENNPHYGMITSEETRKKLSNIRKAWMSNGGKDKTSQAIKNYYKTEKGIENIKMLSIQKNKYYQTEKGLKTRKLISEKIKDIAKIKQEQENPLIETIPCKVCDGVTQMRKKKYEKRLTKYGFHVCDNNSCVRKNITSYIRNDVINKRVVLSAVISSIKRLQDLGYSKEVICDLEIKKIKKWNSELKYIRCTEATCLKYFNTINIEELINARNSY